MRRYRKGELFRPPTAAESAAQADTIEAFKRRAAELQARLSRGMDLVKTPAAGIAGRSGTTIYSATCTRCILDSDAEEKTITETDEELIVFNIDPVPVPGNAYIPVGLLLDNVRYACPGGFATRFGKLDAQLSTGSSATVSLWQKTGGGWDGWNEDSTENVTAYSPPTFNENVDSGTWVLVVNMSGKWVVWDYCCEVTSPTYC